MKNLSFSSCKKRFSHRTLSKVIRFGSELFSPLIPSPSTFHEPKGVNPKDIFSSKEKITPQEPKCVNPKDIFPRQQEFNPPSVNTATHEEIQYHNNSAPEINIASGSALTINPAGYIESVKSPYTNLGNAFFDVSSSSGSSTNSTLSMETKKSSCSQQYTTENTVASSILPPSSGIDQFQLYGSPSYFLALNKSFSEEIDPFLPFEHTYINSGITDQNSYSPCTTMNAPYYYETHDLGLPTVSVYSNTPLTNTVAYHDVFSDNSSLSSHTRSMTPFTAYSYCEEDYNENAPLLTTNTRDIQLEDITDPELRLIVLQSELTKYIASSDETTSLEDIKSNYSTEINTAFMSAKVLSANKFKKGRIENLYMDIVKLYHQAHEKSATHHAINKPLQADVRKENTKSKKRKSIDGEEDDTKAQEPKHIGEVKTKEGHKSKKRRPNYKKDTIDILMDWYLQNDGAPPTVAEKKLLANLTGKSSSQISTWFQNARRRYTNKLVKYQTLKNKYPDAVYNYKSFKEFMHK